MFNRKSIAEKLKKYVSVLLIGTALLLTSCGDGLVKLKYEDGVLKNTKSDINYVSVPTYIEPVSVGEEYAVYKDRDLYLHTIPGLDPEKWLTESYMGIASVFCSEDTEIPDLDTFEPESVIICVSGEITIGIATITDPSKIAEITDLFETGKEEEYPLIDSKEVYSLKFTSEKYKGLYYNLTFGVFEEGQFLYDRYSKRSVRADGILDDYIEIGMLSGE